MIADHITPFVFDALPVRGALINLSRSWRRMLRDHEYDHVIRETLGHAAAATGLIAQSMKFDGAITLQIHGDCECLSCNAPANSRFVGWQRMTRTGTRRRLAT